MCAPGKRPSISGLHYGIGERGGKGRRASKGKGEKTDSKKKKRRRWRQEETGGRGRQLVDPIEADWLLNEAPEAVVLVPGPICFSVFLFPSFSLSLPQ